MSTSHVGLIQVGMQCFQNSQPTIILYPEWSLPDTRIYPVGICAFGIERPNIRRNFPFRTGIPGPRFYTQRSSRMRKQSPTDRNGRLLRTKVADTIIKERNELCTRASSDGGPSGNNKGENARVRIVMTRLPVKRE